MRALRKAGQLRGMLAYYRVQFPAIRYQRDERRSDETFVRRGYGQTLGEENLHSEATGRDDLRSDRAVQVSGHCKLHVTRVQLLELSQSFWSRRAEGVFPLRVGGFTRKTGSTDRPSPFRFLQQFEARDHLGGRLPRSPPSLATRKDDIRARPTRLVQQSRCKAVSSRSRATSHDLPRERH